MVRKIALTISIFLSAALVYGQPFEMFGIDIHAATRSQITGAILLHGAEKLPSNDPATDRYDANAIFSGARMKVGFNADETLDNIVCQFDSGSWFIEVLKFDELKSTLIEEFGQPAVAPDENRHGDLEEELLWMRGSVRIQLINYKWPAAWRLHVTHQLRYTVSHP